MSDFRQKFVLLFLSLFIVGCAFGVYFNADVNVLTLFSILMIVLAFVFRNYIKVFLLAILLVGLLLGITRGTAGSKEANPELVNLYGKYDLVVEGNVITNQEITSKGNKVRFVVESKSIEGIEIDTRILFYDIYPSNCELGNFIQAKGNLIKPKNFLNEYDKVFPYVNYLAKDDIYSIFFANESKCVISDDSLGFLSYFDKSREWILGAINKFINEPESSLLAGLLLGVRGSLGDDLTNIFIVTGLIHIVVLSGYNITIVAEFVRRIFSVFRYRVSIILAILIIIGFVFLAGAHTSSVRAGLMASIILFGKLLKRESDMIPILALVACIMLLFNPTLVLYDVSFQLSFIATLGLLLYSPILDKFLQKIPNTAFQFREIISVTLSVQLFLLPFLAYQIGQVSIIGLLANIIILPLIPITMLLGFMVIVIGVIFPFLGYILSPIAYIPLKFIIETATFLSKPNFANIVLPDIPIWFVLICYIFLLFPLYKNINR